MVSLVTTEVVGRRYGQTVACGVSSITQTIIVIGLITQMLKMDSSSDRQHWLLRYRNVPKDEDTKILPYHGTIFHAEMWRLLKNVGDSHCHIWGCSSTVERLPCKQEAGIS